MLGEDLMRRCALTAAAVGALTVGCDEGPIQVGPSTTEMGTSDDGGTGPDPDPIDMSTTPIDMEVEPCAPRAVFEPDPQYFADQVAPLMYPPCLVCHNDPAPRPGVPFTLVATGPNGLSPEQNQLNVDECLAFVDADAPAESELIVWHPTGHPGYVADGPLKSAIVAWIEDGSRIVEPDPDECGGEPDPDPSPVDMGTPDEGTPRPPVGSDGPPCEALLGEEGNGGARSSTFRDEFAERDVEGLSHNDLLIGSCANNGTCHAIAGEGGDYWLIEGDDECYVEWNFFTTQIYIDWLNPELSPLLSRPTMDEHGGRNVYRGMDDPRRGRLLRWISDEIVRSRTP